MFKGVIPQVDALEKIRRAERVNLDWLISGEGSPYLVPVFRDDTASSEALSQRLGDGGDYMLHILAGRAEAAVVLTLPVVVEYEDETEASFIDVETILPAGPKTLAMAAEWRDHRIVAVGSDVLMQLRNGWLGPVHLIGHKGMAGLLDKSKPASSSEVLRVAEEVDAYQILDVGQEQELTAAFRNAAPEHKAALVTIAKGLVREMGKQD